jgi:putative zinc finger/helix-turn-helix YgiT family protein
LLKGHDAAHFASIDTGLRGYKARHNLAVIYREQGRLAEADIRQGREKLGLTQRESADLLGVGEATISRWETGGQIQQRAMDRFLRVCLASPAAVDLLSRDFQPSAKGA